MMSHIRTKIYFRKTLYISSVSRTFMIKKTKEDYLRSIYHIYEEKDSEVMSIDLCNYLKVSKSTVSEMLKKLSKEKLTKSIHYGKITLTKKGLKEAIEVTRKHRIIEVFLSKILKIKKNIHEEAHRLEHAFSNESISSIESLIQDITQCPHGKPIPKIRNRGKI